MVKRLGKTNRLLNYPRQVHNSSLHISPSVTAGQQRETISDELNNSRIIRIAILSGKCIIFCKNWQLITFPPMPCKLICEIIARRITDTIAKLWGNKLATAEDVDSKTRYLPFATSFNSAQRGRDTCMSTALTLKVIWWHTQGKSIEKM